MQRALESAVTPAPREEVAAWMESFVGDALRARAAHIRAIESDVVADSSGVPSSARAHFDRRRAREVRAAAETNPFGATSVASAHSDDASEPPFDASATHTHRGPPRASRRVWIAAFALAAVAGGFFAAQGVQPRAEAVGNATAPTAEPSPSPPLAPPPTVTDLPRPAPSSEAAPVPVAAPVATTRTRSNPPPPRSRRDCDPPFYWDAKRAVKVYKKECVE
jgi:hypothetical protein